MADILGMLISHGQLVVPSIVQSFSAGVLFDCSRESCESGARFPHFSKNRLNGSEITALNRTPTIVRDTADQIWLSSSIQGTTTATRMTGKNKMAIASACVPGPLNGHSFRRSAMARIHRATGAQKTPPNKTVGSGNIRISSQPPTPLNAATQ